MSKKKKKNKDNLTTKDILAFFQNSSRPLSLKDIHRVLKPNKEQKEKIFSILEDLQNQGTLIRIGNKVYGLVQNMPLLKGSLEIQRSGVGFVLPDDKRRKDVFIPPGKIGEAWHEDRVLVAIIPGKKGKNPEGRIVRVLERKHKELPVLVQKKVGPDLYLCSPTEHKMPFNLLVSTESLNKSPENKDIVLALPGEKLERNLWSAQAQLILGQEEDAQVQEAIVKQNHNIPSVFPQKVLEEAGLLPQSPEPSEWEDRKDLRSYPFVTIDGVKAKDFDDAIYVQKNKNEFILYVAIADVSHYVREKSALDQEALQRANSYYFPQSVEPMFPKILSNGLCSLKPNVPRLAMVAQITFSKNGNPLKSKFYTAVIQSHARLTYSQVKNALLDQNAQEQEKISELMPMLRQSENLARLLYQNRKNRGTLDFDLPEPEILFNFQGETVDIKPKIRHFGHQIIEEFMIAANEAVASFLNSSELPCMYRVHPPPEEDKLKDLYQLLKDTLLGTNLPETMDVKGLQELLSLAEDTDLEFLVNRLILRSMMQAFYTPENSGHFGLASECYCHFTSPIRRYADLIVHRYLKSAINKDTKPGMNLKKLQKAADHLSSLERKAMEAEREIFKRLIVLFLKEKIGQTFTGIIASIADFGFWVELNEVLAEGMVRLSTLQDDYYVYWPDKHKLVGQHTGKIFHLGQKVKVRLTDTNLSRQEINLELEEELKD